MRVGIFGEGLTAANMATVHLVPSPSEIQPQARVTTRPQAEPAVGITFTWAIEYFLSDLR